MSEKNEIENTNSETVETIFEIPEAANLFTTNGSKPAIKAAIVGRRINAIGGIIIFLMRQMINTKTITKPITASFVDGAAGAFLSEAFAGFNMSVKVLYSSSIIFW